uniref:Aspartic proteinase nepenthesin-2 n=1 Tax=Aegilops tauschii TaxID=37682 RepID=R7W3E3_AEGTA
MELLLLLLAGSLIFPLAAPAREITNACTSQANVFQHVNGTGMHLTLHHPQSPCSPAPLPSALPFSAVIVHDEARIARLASRLAKTPSSRPTSLRKSTGGAHLRDSQAPADNEGLFGRSAGLIGLARNKLSLLYQLAPSLGDSFSYCLPTSASPGYLSIGSYTPAEYSYTPMVSSSLDASLYFVSLASMSVAGSPLAVSPSEYGSLATIIDSGTVITRLPTAVYTALSKALGAAMGGAPRAPAYSILDTCFKGQVSKLRVPAVDMAFAGGATLKLAPGNVLIDVDESTTCLAFAATDSTAIIGNTQQQTFSVVYDVAQSRIGFAAGGCS